MHNNTSLLIAIDKAGSRASLCHILGITHSNLSKYLSHKLNLPMKHAVTIEEWSNGAITVDNLLPLATKKERTKRETKKHIDNFTHLLNEAEKKGIDINIDISISLIPKNRGI